MKYDEFMNLVENTDKGIFLLTFEVNEMKQLAIYDNTVPKPILIPMQKSGECIVVGQRMITNASNSIDKVNRLKILQSWRGKWPPTMRGKKPFKLKSISVISVYVEKESKEKSCNNEEEEENEEEDDNGKQDDTEEVHDNEVTDGSDE